ncbi:Pc12g15230 [Penicillium rubens Wisconsin 54-1255]|uniref:Pc12g15230 protein n=1 Tax=Penicillium rubens (strain ATCC 28089 / DSM 1075 / NRRL 1951 / Wisconsin 54-1255) TaxID=500485 RepID=B6GXG9_PENRW|nr:Pc12g15230 [Penicillium rubens Wisconsin 54-1255]
MSYPGEYNNHNVNNPNDTFCYCTFAGLYDQVNLKRAFGWSLTQTQAFMVGVVDNPSTYGVDSQVVPELKRLHTDIVALSENGAKYQTGDPYPQPFSRIVNPAAASKNESYLLLDKTTYGGFPYWCSFDLLGRFLSIIGPAPQNATNYNFYLPLAMMYGNWRRKIAPHPPPPNAYSCVWAEETGKQSHFQLGASLGGYAMPQQRGGLWARILKQARFDILRDERLDAVGITAWSSTLKSRTSNNINFGNCAETYPLAHVLRDRKPHEEVYGLAVTLSNDHRNRYTHPQALRSLMRPCLNCQRVIGLWGGKVENFFTDDMLEDRPTTSSGMQSPTSVGPNPRAPGSKINLPAHKRPSPGNSTDTAGPTPKRAKGMQSPASVGPNPKASVLRITLPARLKRPSPGDNTDTAEPTPKRAKGPSHLGKGKGKTQ